MVQNLTEVRLAQGARIEFLDGLRALAVLSVVLFHYLFHIFHESSFVIYQNYEIDIFRYGAYGVYLFFCISGFVITLTLERSVSFYSFMIKRYIRLLPLMILASISIYIFSFIDPHTYRSSYLYFIPSLTFIGPNFLNELVGGDIFSWMDGSFWTLFVELRFYIIVSLLFFFSRKYFLINYLIFYFFIMIIYILSVIFDMYFIRSISNLLFFASFHPWFVLGVGMFYLFKRQKLSGFICISAAWIGLYFSILASEVNPYQEVYNFKLVYAMGVVTVLVFSAIVFPLVSRILSFRPLVWVGVASYGIYLFHNNIGQKIIFIILEYDVSKLNFVIFSVSLTFILVLICYFLHIYYEKRAISYLNRTIFRK